MKILMVASEATPFAKTGGLADVVGALSATLRAHGNEVAIVMPRYGHISLRGLPRVYDDLRVWFGPASHAGSMYKAVDRDIRYYLVDFPQFFERDGLYGDANGDYRDNHLRFAAFSHAALNVIRHLFRPDVVHCHDWQTSLVPVYMRAHYPLDPSFLGPKAVLTLHNLGYQGTFPREVLPEIGLDDSLFRPDALEFHGLVNYLKAGILYSDALTTVSRSYAREIQEPELGFGLEGVLRARGDALFGIQNGVDYTRWDPATDTHIAAHFSPQDLAGKRICKADLLAAFGLPDDNLDRPVLAMIARLVPQKGLDLIEEQAEALVAEDVCLVVLGEGDPRYHDLLNRLAAEHPGRVGVRIGWDEPLSHKIEAGADMLLMPSHYEPSGLNQIYSLRYGTVPVVRATGGLDDTIEEGETGFKFREYTGRAFMDSLRQALAAWRDQERWKRLMLAGMRRDFSWNTSAREYRMVYERVTGTAAAA